MKVYLLLTILFMFMSMSAFGAAPKITGQQIKYNSGTIEWPKNWPVTEPAIEGGANLINDLNAGINNCNLVVSTAGNYNVALADLMHTVYLPRMHYLNEHGNWLYTTSPPISVPHAKSGELTIGNFKTTCGPNVAIGPKKLMQALKSSELIDSEPVAFMSNQGNVLLVKKGNPKNIRTIWDIGSRGVKLVTSDLDTESGSGGNYSNSIYNMAIAERGKDKADRLFNRIYNNDTENRGTSNYVSWGPIMHRGVPQAIKDNLAQVAIVFYHLALQYTRQFPGDFEIIPLGGTVDNPEPVQGNKIATLFVVEVKGNGWKNHYFAEQLISDYMSDEFTDILAKHGILRP